MANDQAGFLRGTPPSGDTLGALLVEANGTLSVADATTELRYSGGKTPATGTTTTGTDTMVSASPSQRITLYWVSAINDPDQALSPLITIKLGSTELYRAYAIAHWEPFTGVLGDDLTITLDQTGSVAWTAHYTLA